MKVINSTTTYVGGQFPNLHGARVRIFGVLRGALRRDVNIGDDNFYVTEEGLLARLGGVRRHDCVDIAAMQTNGVASIVRYAARAEDLACFAHLNEC